MAASTSRPADLVLTGGAIFTADSARSWAQALAVEGGRIVAVGGDRDVRPLIGHQTRVIDLHGRTVTPGFQDAHVHPPHGGLYRLRCELHGLTGRETYLATIDAWLRANPGEPWLRGGGWSMGDFPGGTPRKEDLDRVCPDRPAFLPNRDGHGAWVNSRALALAGITAEMPDPPDGRIERDADGSPSGTLHEGAMDLVERLVPRDTVEELEQAILESQRYLHSLGITAWQDAIVTEQTLAAYLAIAGRGELTARVVGALWWERDEDERQVERLLDQRTRGQAPRFAATSVKIMQDGVAENFTAAMTADYLDTEGRSSGNRGLSFVEPGLLERAVTRLDAEGFQVHFHALGDRAVREGLDAIEAARLANGWSDGRHHLAHLQLVHPDDRPRFRQLGAIANAQPYWAVHEPQMDELTIPFLGPERTAWQYPWRSLRAAGAMLAMGSDWSVSTPDPLLQLEVAVNRVSDQHRDAPPFLPGERLELVDALTAFTAGSAYVNHLDEAGSIAVGHLADLAILDRDLFDGGAGPIGAPRVLATFIEGVPVFETGDLGG
jgi:predicted amidohydrolase YtcJ